MHKTIKILLIITFWIITVNGELVSQINEYTMKAVAFEHISRFIEWPENALSDDLSQPFVIAVLGKNPFGETLEKIYYNHKIKNKEAKIIYIDKITNLNNCHILFICESEEKEIDNIIRYTDKKPILLVSDTKDLAKSGVHVNFSIIDNKIRFEINEKEMDNSGFSVSYLLVRVSKIINPK